MSSLIKILRRRISLALLCIPASARLAMGAGLCVCVALVLGGCAHEPPRRGSAFTPEWTREIGVTPQENGAEDNDGENGESNVIIGDEDGARVEIEDGGPKFRMGQDGGWEAGVQSGTGRVGYRWEW